MPKTVAAFGGTEALQAFNSRAHDPLTPYFAATFAAFIPRPVLPGLSEKRFSVAWIHVDVTREDGATAGRSDYVRVEVPEPEPEPALPLIGQLLLGVGLLGGGARRLYRRRCQTTVYDTG